MFRSELTEGTAMLFQWDRDGARSFWMDFVSGSSLLHIS